MAQRGTWLACRICGHVHIVTDPMTVIPRCSDCKRIAWKTMDEDVWPFELSATDREFIVTLGAWPFDVTANDRRFLKMLRISPGNLDGRADEFR